MELILNSNDVRNSILEKRLQKERSFDITPKDVNLNEYIKLVNDVDLNVERKVANTKINFEKIIDKAIQKGANYIIKAMPVNQGIKNILINVNDALKTKDFKGILKVAIDSSIKEGLKTLGAPISTIKDIIKLKDIAINGGLKETLCGGIDIISNKYSKNNLFGNIIKDFFDKVKQYIKTNKFLMNIDNGISKLNQKLSDFKTACNKWNKAYNSMNINEINDSLKQIKKYKYSKILSDDQFKQCHILENMTSLVNTKKGKLSDAQLQMCQSL